MSHDYAPDRDPEVQALLSPEFREPAPTMATAARKHTGEPYAYTPAEVASHPQPVPDVTTATAPAEGPTPLVEGAVAIFATPDGSAVICFRARGAAEDKKMVLPPFLIDMACSQAGRTREELFAALREGL